MNNVKKWIPFSLILLMAFIALLKMILFTDDPYIPATQDPEIIYYEACSSCHGDDGRGKGLLYPPVKGEHLGKEQILKKIKEGGWLMPRFNNIKGDTLKNLTDFVYKSDFAE